MTAWLLLPPLLGVRLVSRIDPTDAPVPLLLTPVQVVGVPKSHNDPHGEEAF